MKQQRQQRMNFGFFKTASFWISIVVSLLVAVAYLLSRPEIAALTAPEFLELVEAKTLDLRFLARGARKPPPEIVIVAVDEKTEDELGRWQSAGRQWLAQFVDILSEGNAAVVGFDVTLAEPDDRRDLRIVDDITERYEFRAGEHAVAYQEMLFDLQQLQTQYDYDGQLANAIFRAGNVVLGIYFLNEAASAHLDPDTQAAYQGIIRRAAYQSILFPPGITSQKLLSGFHASGVEPNLPIFSNAAYSFGFFNVLPDSDGYVRSMPLLEEYGGKYYPSLALEMARAYLNAPLPPFIHALGAEGGGNIAGIELNGLMIPCDDMGRLLVNYYGPGHTFSYYSLSDVVLGKVPPDTFADKVVLLGFTSVIVRDLLSTPFQAPDFPGVEIQATTVANILSADFLTRPEWALWLEAAQILLLGLVLGIAHHRRSPLWAVWAALICVAVIVAEVYAAFWFKQIWLNVTYPVLFVIVDYLTITSYRYFTEEKQKRDMKNAFQHYVSSNVVDHLLQQTDRLKLGGERRELTALFSDIRDFTSISEGLPPEQLVEFLNAYLSEMSQIVLRYEGTIDKYMGDAVMAFYGAPVEQSDHAARACKTAVDMMARLRELQTGWAARGLPPVNIGIGINSGDMSVGNMGARDRFDYTIMGANVNLASRLEGINTAYGTNIVISEFTYALIEQQAFTVRELDTVRVKGKHEPVTIYELLGYGTLYEHKKPLVDIFCRGLAAYKERQWDQALQHFNDALQRDPSDSPSQLYRTRCETYKQSPPPDEWDGVFVMTTK